MLEHNPHVLRVLALSPGIAIGPVHLYGVINQQHETTQTTMLDPAELAAEYQRLLEALEKAQQELQQLSEQASQTVGAHEAEILLAQQMMLADPDFQAAIQASMHDQRLSAATAVRLVAEQQAQDLEALTDSTLAARGADIRDAAMRVIRLLTGQTQITKTTHLTPSLLVANDLAPSDTIGLKRDTTLGICTVAGGPTTHTAILARALEIPAVAGLDPTILSTLQEGQEVGIDGTQGLLYLAPSPTERKRLYATMRQQQRERAASHLHNEQAWRHRPAMTADGHSVRIFANVGDQESAQAARDAGAEGIGLLRTEFLFAGRTVLPDEQEQLAAYTALFRTFLAQTTARTTIVARTLDAGADKPFPALEPYLGALQEANPALGLRGIRIHLVREDLLRTQLRALLRAGAETAAHLHMLFPMIATVEEVRRVRMIYTQVREELAQTGMRLPAETQLGVMIETPAAALMADALAREIDFFSIGANDLYQYTLAVDRTNSRVTGMFGRLEPAVWRLIEIVVRAAQAQNKVVAVCGEIAGDPKIGPALVGLGIEELSMNPPAIVRLKAALHEHSLEYWQHLAQQMLKADTAKDIEHLLLQKQ